MPEGKTIAEDAPPGRQPRGFRETVVWKLDALTQRVDRHRRDGDHVRALSDIMAVTHKLFQQSAPRAMSLSSPALNREAARLSESMLAGSAYKNDAPALGVRDGIHGKRRQRVILLATLLSDIGGHSRLVEDIVRRFVGRMDIGLVLTGLTLNEAPLTREAFDPSRLHIHCLDDDTHIERLHTGWDVIKSFAPDVIVDFSHPYDMICFALLHSAPARRKLHVWHADHSFALRPVDPETGLVSVTAYGEACARHYARGTGQAVINLPMTCADPYADVPEAAMSAGLRADDAFLTATCGSIAKFLPKTVRNYVDFIAARFRARGGAHVHIGPLTDDLKEAVTAAAVSARSSATVRHLPYVESLSQTLALLKPDIYLSSYPVAGGKATVEAMAAGCAIVHAVGHRVADGLDNFYPGALNWRTLDEFETCLAGVTADTVDCQRRLARAYFERAHAPALFEATLERLLSGAASESVQ